MKILIQTLFISTTLLSAACTKDTTSNEATPTFPIITDANHPILEKVNTLRVQGCKCGTTTMKPVPSLTWNGQLMASAQAHSDDMKAHNNMNHTGSDGSSFSQRITRAGYEWRTAGENIAFGYATEQAVFDGWKASVTHCKNMMNPDFKDIGVARADKYWTMDLGSK